MSKIITFLEQNWQRISRVLFIITILTVTYLALIPDGQPMGMNDKLNHMAAFFTLTLLLDAAIRAEGMALPIIIFLAAYGIGIEIAQNFFAARHFSMLDWGTDLCAILLYFLTIPLLRHIPVVRSRWYASHS